MKYTAVINVNLSYELEASSEEDAMEQAVNLELPSEYEEDTFEVVKIIKC